MFAGDFCPPDKIEGGDPQTIFPAEMKEIFDEGDIRVVNLESPLLKPGRGKQIKKIGPHLKCHPESLNMLVDLKVDVVTLANNHIRDYGNEGVLATLEYLRERGIFTVGAGLNLDEAKKILYVNKRDTTIAFINVAESEFANASMCRAGANPFDLISLLHDLEEAKRKADYVILIVHGGLEYSHYPSPESVKLFRFLAEQGVTAIVRHHPHYVQGYEVWKDVPIFYSLGNFLYKGINKFHPGMNEGIVVCLELDKNEPCSFTIYPFMRDKKTLGIKVLHGEEKNHALIRLQLYSSVLRDEKDLIERWKQILSERKNQYYSLLALPHPFFYRVFRKLNLLSFVRPSERKRLLIENLIRCEAHREALLGILESEHD